MKVGERRSDVEFELESEDPTEVDGMVFSEEEESREVIVTSVEHRDPTVMSAGDEQEAACCAEVPVPRKRPVSADIIGEWEVKRTPSPCPSVRCRFRPHLSRMRPSKPGGPRSGLAPAQCRDRRQRMTHHGRMPRLLPRLAHLEPKVAVTHRPGRSRLGRLRP